MISSEAILYYATHPVEFVVDVIGAQPDGKQAEILRSVSENQKTSVRSGHGIGKSTVEAWTIIWFIATRPFPKIPCTAPTQHQLFDILWAEISKWLRHSPALPESLILQKEKLFMKGYSEEWFAVPRTASKPDALQGFHAENILFVIDEASGVSDNIFEPVLGALSTDGSKLLMCGNPTQLSGFFYDSHHKNAAQYSTFHIDGRQSPRVSDEFVQSIINMYGENSDVFRVRVAGEFPLAEDDIFISLPLVEKSIATEYIPRAHPWNISIGCDVARFGDDKSVISYRVDEKLEIYRKRRGQSTMDTADDIVQCGKELVARYHLKKGDDYPITVKVDDTGVGGGVVDRLNQIKKLFPDEYWWLEIHPITFGTKIQHKYYDDTTTYMMGVVKALLNPHDEYGNAKPVELILPDDGDLVGQLTTRKYYLTDNGKMRVESKKAMKERGLSSPDEADSVLLACLPISRPRGKKAKS